MRRNRRQVPPNRGGEPPRPGTGIIYISCLRGDSYPGDHDGWQAWWECVPEGPDADEDNLTKLSPYGTLEEILAWVRTHPARRRILRTGDGEFDVTADGRVGARLMIPPDPSR